MTVEEKIRIKNKKPDDKIKRSILCKGQLFGEDTVLDLVRRRESKPVFFSVSSTSSDGLLLSAPIGILSKILYHENQSLDYFES